MTSLTRPSVRSATIGDAAELASVHIRSWQAAYRDLLPRDYLGDLDSPHRIEQWQHALLATDWSRAGVVVAVPGRGLLGFASFGPARDADEDASQVGEIREIYLLPEAWGRGFGKRLMSITLARLAFAGYSQVMSWVPSTNTRARRFCEAGGWTCDGGAKHDDSMGFPIEEVRYRRQLAGRPPR